MAEVLTGPRRSGNYERTPPKAIELGYAAPLAYATGDGPLPARIDDLVVVGHRTRLPPICVRTGRTADEAEAAGTQLVNITMSYDRRIWPTTLVIILSGGCIPILLLGLIPVLVFSPPIKVNCWASRGVSWTNKLLGIASALGSLAGMVMASAGAVAFLAWETNPTLRWIPFTIWVGGIAVLVVGQMLHEFFIEPLRRAGWTQDGLLKLSNAPRSLLDSLPAAQPG